MALKWSHTIETFSYSDMRAMMSLIKKHTNINADTVNWMHTLAFDAKSNSEYNLTWDGAMKFPHKGVYWLLYKKEINKLHKKRTW